MLLAGIIGAAISLAQPGLSSAAEIFIPLGDDNKIIVIDSNFDAVIDTIHGISNPHGLAATPDGRYLVAGSLDERPANSSNPIRLPDMSADDHVVYHSNKPDGAHKVGAYISTLSILGRSDRTVIRRIDVLGAAHHVAVSPDSKIAAVTHPGEGTVSLIDLVGSRVIRTIATGLGPNYAAFDQTGRHLYVSNAGSATISEIDTRTWIVRRTMQAGRSPEHLVLSPDGASLYVNNVDDGTVSVLSLASGKEMRAIVVGDYSHSIDLSDDGRTLFVSDRGKDELSAIHIDSQTKMTISLGPSPYHIAVIHGEGKLYVSSAEEPKIWVINQKSLQVTAEIPIGGRGHQMVVQPKI